VHRKERWATLPIAIQPGVVQAGGCRAALCRTPKKTRSLGGRRASARVGGRRKHRAWAKGCRYPRSGPLRKGRGCASAAGLSDVFSAQSRQAGPARPQPRIHNWIGPRSFRGQVDSRKPKNPFDHRVHRIMRRPREAPLFPLYGLDRGAGLRGAVEPRRSKARGGGPRQCLPEPSIPEPTKLRSVIVRRRRTGPEWVYSGRSVLFLATT